jgi:hypothetical protein
LLGLAVQALLFLLVTLLLRVAAVLEVQKL